MRVHKGFKCLRCCFVFPNEDEWKAHEKDFQESNGLKDEGSMKCEHCNQLVNSKCLQRKHTFAHIGHVCSLCQEVFQSLSELVVHRNKHNGGEFPCDKCERVFRTTRERSSHAVIHKEQLCGICGILVKGSLKKHACIRSSTKPFICTYEGCGKGFYKKHSLTSHRKIHLNQRLFVCDIGDCKSRFNQLPTLIAHKRTHSNDKRYKCHLENCDRAFHLRFDLQKHIRRHTGEKPFECDMCPRAFYTGSCLRTHQKTCLKNAT